MDGAFLEPDFATYFGSLISAPLVVFVLCIVACILFMISMLFRCCCWCFKCKPREMPETEQDKLILIKRRDNKIIVFFVFLAVIVAADHAGYWGVKKFNDGMENVSSGMGSLKDNFSVLGTSSSSSSSSILLLLLL